MILLVSVAGGRDEARPPARMRQDFSAQAIALGLLLVLELTLGSLLAATGFPLLAVLAHNLVAALLLALLAGLA